jgi:predicted HicB family RNase H-like nuclease
METIVFKKDEMDALEDSISAEGDSVVFSQYETEKSGRDYLLACSQNDKDERAHRAEVMKDATRIVIF